MSQATPLSPNSTTTPKRGGGELKLSIKNLQVRAKPPQGSEEGLTIINDLNLDARKGEFVCILGPSGCGKSTLLRVIAGLLPKSAGELNIESDNTGRPLTSMVFQDHALLPWRTVMANVVFGLENLNVPVETREKRAKEMLELVQLGRYGKFYPHQLSGGMRQRVGIARALATNPELLLMDEPLASVDAQTRLLLQEQLLKIWDELGQTIIYVTHSIEEALLMGDRIYLLGTRPARVKAVFEVNLPRPRTLESRATPEFGALMNDIWHELRDEVVRAAASEVPPPPPSERHL